MNLSGTHRLLQASLFTALFSVCLHAGAQAASSDIRSSAIDLYAAGTFSSTDYGSNDQGFLIGGDFTKHLRYFDASLDLRYNHVTGDVVGEKYFDGGVKIAKAYRRYHPYAHFLFGYGVITFDQPAVNPDGTLYSYDNSKIYDLGGGLDYDLTRSFSLKIDGQYQYWNLGSRNDAGSVKLNPAIASFGIVYHLPYRFLRPRRY